MSERSYVQVDSPGLGANWKSAGPRAQHCPSHLRGPQGCEFRDVGRQVFGGSHPRSVGMAGRRGHALVSLVGILFERRLLLCMREGPGPGLREGAPRHGCFGLFQTLNSRVSDEGGPSSEEKGGRRNPPLARGEEGCPSCLPWEQRGRGRRRGRCRPHRSLPSLPPQPAVAA